MFFFLFIGPSKQLQWCWKTTLDGNEEKFPLCHFQLPLIPAAPNWFLCSDCSFQPKVQVLLQSGGEMSSVVHKGWEGGHQTVARLLYSAMQNQPGSSWTPLDTDGEMKPGEDA